MKLKTFETWKVSKIGTLILTPAQAQMALEKGAFCHHSVKVLGHDYVSELKEKDLELAYRAYCLKFIVDNAIPFLAGDDAFDMDGNVRDGYKHLYQDIYILESDIEEIK